MPRLDIERPASGPRIEAFSGNGFRVDGVIHNAGLKITPEAAWTWDAPSIEMLGEADLADLLGSARPEFILLGTGATLRRPAPALVAAIEAKGSGLEVMDSRAAARAWGVLRGEGREIVGALLPLGI